VLIGRQGETLNSIGEEERREASAFVASGVGEPIIALPGEGASKSSFEQRALEREINARWWIAALVVGALMWTWFLTAVL